MYKKNALYPVLRIWIRDLVLFYPLDLGSRMEQCSDPEPGSGSGIRDKQTKFVNSLYTKIGRIRDPVFFYPPDPAPRFRNGAMVGSESGLKHLRSATLATPFTYLYL
jgi:hypothetical protein